MKYRAFPGIVLLLFISTIYPQTLRVSGTVINEVTGIYMEDANVLVENTNTGTATDSSGRFYLTCGIKRFYLLISHIGFKTARIYINRPVRDTLIKLKPVNYLMKEVHVHSPPEYVPEFLVGLRKEQVKKFAGISKDALRSVQLLPGVSNNNEATSKINVRGGTSDENIILINGIEIHDPFHLKEYPMTGLGIFNMDMVRKIEFSAGGFPARYGGAISSMLNVEYDPGNIDRFSSNIDISTADMSAYLQIPFGGKSSLIAGFRKSFINRMLYLLTPRENLPEISFYDFQCQYNYNITPNNGVKLNFIISKDVFNDYPHTETIQRYERASVFNLPSNRLVKYDKYTSADYDCGNILAALNSTNNISESISAETIISFNREYENLRSYTDKKGTARYSANPLLFQNSSEIYNLSDLLNVDYFSFAGSLNLYPDKKYSMKIGGEFRKNIYTRHILPNGTSLVNTNLTDFPDTTISFTSFDPEHNERKDISTSTYLFNGYLENIIRLRGGLLFNIGGRIEYSDINKNFSLSPRVQFSCPGPHNTVINAAWGYYFQTPGYRQLKCTSPSDTNTQNQKAEHFIISLEEKFSPAIKVQLDFYYKKYSNLIPSFRLSDGSIDYGGKQNSGKGFAQGIDAQIIAEISGISLRFCYGYLIARERNAGAGEPYYPRFTDQTHTIAADFNAKFLSKGEIRLNFFYGSGYAFTPSYLKYNGEYSVFEWTEGRKNSSHFPAYIRLDFGVSGQFYLLNNPLTIYLEVMNVFNKRNVYSYLYNFKKDTGEPVTETLRLLPVVPSLGIIYELQ